MKLGMRAWIRASAAIVVACLILGVAVVPAVSAAPTRGKGYWVASSTAQTFAFGDGQTYPPRDPRRAIRGQIVDMAAHPGGRGYWLLGSDGKVYPYGEARDLGQPVLRGEDVGAVAIATTPTGNGYLVVSDFGEVSAFGDAVSRGSMDRKKLQRRIVDMSATRSGAGYWLVDSSGQVFGFGDAGAFGSVPRPARSTGSDKNDRGDRQNEDSNERGDIIAIAGTPKGDGYWIATTSGGIFAFGGAVSFGGIASPSRRGDQESDDDDSASRRVADLTPTYTGQGYWMVSRSGQVSPFGDAVLYGQPARKDLRGQAVAIAATPFVNHDPVANTDTVSLDEDTTADVNVLANDTDEDGDALKADVLAQPAHGTATRNADGTIKYVPVHDFNGSDSFTYTVIDGFGGRASGRVLVAVRPVNDPPIAADDAFTTDEDTSVTGSLVINDIDVDGDTLTAQVMAGPAHGALVLTGGRFAYLPALNYNGDDSFTYKAFDGLATSGVAMVKIHINPVNDAPVAVADAGTLNEDETLVVAGPGVLANDTDVEGDALSAILVSGPAHGTLTLDPTGGYTYVPAPNYNGADSFVYHAFDGALPSADVTVTVTIVAVNDAPVAVVDSAKVNEDETLTVKAPGVLGNDTDVDGDVMTAVLVAGPAHGKLALNPDGSYTYTGEKDFFGDDSFSYRASDGTLASDVVTVGITVVGVNDPPVTKPDAYEVNEDERLAVEQPGILVNDNDIDSPTLSAVLVTTTSHGDLLLAPDGSFTYVPLPNFFGIDTFVYHASDGDLESGDTTVTIGVAAVNDPPVASPDSYTIDEDTVLTVAVPGVMANDSDVDGDALQVRLFEQPANGSVILSADGSFEYTPDLNYNGTDTFTYQLSDGEVIVVGTVTITIRAVYDPPDANNDSYATTTGTTLTVAAPGVLANDLADTGLTLTADLVTGVAHGALTLNPDGSFTYTTSLTAAGTDSFTYRVNDGTSVSSPATVSITIAAAGGTGGHGEFNGFTRATQAIYDVDELNLHTSGAVTLQPKLGKIVTKYGSAWYIPSRGQRGHDTFIVGGVLFQVDVLSDVWGD